MKRIHQIDNSVRGVGGWDGPKHKRKRPESRRPGAALKGSGNATKSSEVSPGNSAFRGEVRYKIEVEVRGRGHGPGGRKAGESV